MNKYASSFVQMLETLDYVFAMLWRLRFKWWVISPIFPFA